MEIKHDRTTAVWQKWRFSASYDSFVLRNQPERKARKRWQ